MKSTWKRSMCGARKSRAPRFVAVAALLSATFAAAAPAHAAPPADHTYRVLSWNIYGLPETPLSSNSFAMSMSDRAALLAATIAANDYDVVGINEAFHVRDLAKDIIDMTLIDPGVVDEMGDELHEVLSNHYAFSISKMEDGNSSSNMGGGFLPSLDPIADLAAMSTSGLQIYTHFQPIARESLMNVGDDGLDWHCLGTFAKPGSANVGDDDEEPDVVAHGFSGCAAAFLPYSGLGGDDGWSSKGVGWMRVLNTKTNRPLNIFVTHAQADYVNEAHVAERASNMAEAQAFIDAVAPPSVRGAEDILFLGDFNVISTDPEYQTEFGAAPNTGHFTAMGVKDLWTAAPDGTSADPGYTQSQLNNHKSNQDPNRRFDYITDSLSPNAAVIGLPVPCVQHIKLRRDFDIPLTPEYEEEGNALLDLSDHYAVEATIGRSYPYCSPGRARLNIPDGIHTMSLPSQNTWQWLYFDHAGTYTIDAGAAPESGGFTIEAYDAKELSEPIKTWMNDPDVGPGDISQPSPFGAPVYDENDPVVYSARGPFYVRIVPKNPAYAGAYELYIHKHKGLSFDDALGLHYDDEPWNYTMTAQTGLTSLQTTAYFSMKTAGRLDTYLTHFNLTARQLTAAYQPPAAGTAGVPLRFDTYLEPDPAHQGTVAPVYEGNSPYLTPNAGFAMSYDGTVPLGGSMRYVVVQRKGPTTKNPWNVPASFNLYADTTTRVVSLDTLLCVEQEDGILEDDQPYTWIHLDQSAEATPFQYTALWGDCDTGQPKSTVTSWIGPDRMTEVAIDQHAIGMGRAARIDGMDRDDTLSWREDLEFDNNDELVGFSTMLGTHMRTTFSGVDHSGLAPTQIMHLALNSPYYQLKYTMKYPDR